jgi:hypothetical protein
MSLAGWYLHKADQCAQMAKEATEPHRRVEYEERQKAWLQLAKEIELEKEIQLKSKPKISN